VGGPGEPELRAGDAGLALAGNAALAPLLGVEGADWEESTARAMAAAGLGWVVVDTWAIEALQQRSTLDDQTWFLDDLTDAVELGLGPPVETVDGLRLYRVPQ
jgi:hypothetical protein